ncbi:MAG: hypothetical protein GY895_16935 [Phycisphaera sp.]|nr:hypothetical protein [Phycisphaera sp.]
MNHSPLDPDSTSRAARLRPFGLGVAAAFLGLALVPESTWIEIFQHPIRVERLGGVPDTTKSGIQLLRFLLWIAAIAWLFQPFAQRWLDRRLPCPSRPADRQIGTGVLGLLMLITIVGIVLRGLRLQESLWYDEIAAMISSSLHGPGVAFGNYHALANHALHSAIAAISLRTLGGEDAELALRLPAFLAGVACIPAMFNLGRAVADDRLGLIAAMIVALMPVAILESAEARGYSMVMFFAILATLAWLRIGDGRAFAIPAYALLVSLGCWTHLVFACVPLGHGLQAIIRGIRHAEARPAAARWAVALMLGGVTTMTLIAPLIPDILARRSEFIAIDGDEPSIFGIEGWMALLQLGGTWNWWTAIPGLALFGFGITEASRWPRIRLASHAGLAGGLVALMLVLGGGSWIYARFLVFLLIPAALLIAAGLEGMAIFTRRGYPSMLAGAGLIVAWMLSLAILPAKQPIRDGVELARTLVGPEEAIWSIGLGDDVAMFYTEGRGPRLVHAPSLGAELGSNDLAVGPNVALMLYPDRVSPETWSELEAAGFESAGRFEGWLDWGNGDVMVLQRVR